MPDQRVEVVVAGHICLDIIPTFAPTSLDIGAILRPGKLVNVGKAIMATGGVVSNAGIALHRLGTRVAMMGKVGDDDFGKVVLALLRRQDPALTEGMVVVSGEDTSYSVVLSVPGTDRIFLHNPGANDTFSAADLDPSHLGNASILHFGYPPIMKRMFEDGGSQLEGLLKKCKGTGITTSLDMTRPDPDSPSGRADWPTILRRALPYVDIFLPSLEELIYMLDRPLFDRLSVHGSDLARWADGELLGRLSQQMLDLGCAIAAIKLGDQGLYVRTTSSAERLKAMGRWQSGNPGAWLSRELLVPCFKVNVAGTNGSGDCTIAGFLASLLHDLPPEEALSTAVAVGACNVEQADATSGVPAWETVRKRMQSPWPRLEMRIKLPGWTWCAEQGVWRSARDARK